ncbi:tRNA guanosine(34) transglycosylase Tgt [bacterium]|nr:tRNA guanosine(34) transglycosylase Tgt [bacterium]MBU1652307.1 tRNA guanosine(34) transglycosylase Tgt [bacterium]
MTIPEWEKGFHFEVLAEDSNSKARLGKLTTPHGVVFTPAFMPVGTYGAVKGILPEMLDDAGAEILLSNALHLEFRPGSDTVAELGGLHRLMGWNRPILTDSGGFQTYSLADLIKQHDDGIEVRAPMDGSKHQLTPEKVIQIQRNLGTDLMMPLDVCAPGQAPRQEFERALVTTQSWAKRSKEAFASTEPLHGNPQALFGIVQGGIHENLRRQAAVALLEIEFFAYAVGGLAVGETKEDTWRIIDFCTGILPRDQIRYMMGTGTPEDLDMAISLGIDLFDCVMPTRNGRKGTVFVTEGKLNLRNALFRNDPSPIEDGCHCYACRKDESDRPRFSRGAIRHFLNVGEVIGMQLGALHNLTFYLNRLAVIKQGLEAFKT